MNAAADTAKARVAAAVHQDRVMQPLDELSGLARSILRRVEEDFPGIFETRRDRRAGDREGGAK
jgi:hypothetical protein